MSDSTQPVQAGESRAKRLRGAINIATTIQVLIWLALFVNIYLHSNPRGDGMEWVATVPATFILGLGVAPYLAFRDKERWRPIGVVWAVIGVLLGAAFFLEIAREFGESAAR